MVKGGFTRGDNVGRNRTTPDVDTQQWNIRDRLGRIVHDLRRDQRVRDCAAVAVHARKRVVAYFGSGRPTRRSTYPFRGSIALALVVAASCGLDAWWDPVSWWNSIAGISLNVIDDIKNFVRIAVAEAVNMLSSGLDLLDFVMTVVTNALQNSLNFAYYVAASSWNWIQQAENTVGGWINIAWNGFWRDVVAPAIGYVQDVVNFGIAVVSAAISDVNNALDWVVSNVLDPAWSWIVNAAQTVAGWIGSALDDFYNFFIAPIVADAEAAYHLLDTLWDWFWNEAANAVNVVLQAWDWLVWFSEHSFDDLRSLLTLSDQGITLETLLGVAGSQGGVYTWMEDQLADLFR